jgi:broad specificity phosphatase PhoE
MVSGSDIWSLDKCGSCVAEVYANSRMDRLLKQLIVLRHGETDYNRQGIYQGSTDTGLNERGVSQAIVAAERLKEFDFDCIVSSPLKRALQTAEIVSGVHDLPIKIIDEFAERNMGCFEGLTRQQIGNHYPELEGWLVTRQFYASPPQGESLFDFSSRLASGIAKLKKVNVKRGLLLVCHGGVARSVHGIMRRVNDEGVFDYKLENCETDVYEW